MMGSRIYCGGLKTAFSVWRKPKSDISCLGFAIHSNSLPVIFSQDRLLPFGDSFRNLHTTHKMDETYKVNMPSLSPTMTEGTIVKWVKKEGEPIAAGDVLCEIQTDKAVVSMEYDDDAVLAKILVPENTADVKVGTLIALAVDEGDDWKAVKVPADSGASPPAPATSKPAAPAVKKENTPSGSRGSDRLLGPAVKNYLKKYGLTSSQISASGPHGTVTKGDVLQHVQTKNLRPVSLDSSSQATPAAPSKTFKSKKGKSGPASFVDVEVTNMRRTIAKRLLQSKSTIPHAYGIAQCNMNNLVACRKKLASAGLKVSVNDLIVKCVANALTMNPAINCVWEGSQLKHQSSVDISVAVATPNGLITPIVWNVGSKDVCDISSTVKTLAAKAKDGKLQPHEFMGGTFSISNLGMFGVTSFSAIINPPQCAILAVGGTSAELDETGKRWLSSKLMLSYDGSAIMEDEATKFLAILKNEIEKVNEISTGVFSIEAKSELLSEQASLSK